MYFGWMLLAFAAGVLIPVQAAINTKMGRCCEQPLISSLLNFAVGTVALIVVVYFVLRLGGSGNLGGAANAPWWGWLGGLLGAVFVTTSILAFPRLGAAGFSMAMLAGQLLGAVIIDHRGLFELQVKTFDGRRMLACLFALAAVWLMNRPQAMEAAS